MLKVEEGMQEMVWSGTSGMSWKKTYGISPLKINETEWVNGVQRNEAERMHHDAIV